MDPTFNMDRDENDNCERQCAQPQVDDDCETVNVVVYDFVNLATNHIDDSEISIDVVNDMVDPMVRMMQVTSLKQRYMMLNLVKIT